MNRRGTQGLLLGLVDFLCSNESAVEPLSRGPLASHRRDLAGILGQANDTYWRAKQDELLTGREAR